MLDWIWTGFFFILGLLFGSFFNVVGLRIPKNMSIVSPIPTAIIASGNFPGLKISPFFPGCS